MTFNQFAIKFKHLVVKNVKNDNQKYRVDLNAETVRAEWVETFGPQRDKPFTAFVTHLMPMARF